MWIERSAYPMYKACSCNRLCVIEAPFTSAVTTHRKGVVLYVGDRRRDRLLMTFTHLARHIWPAECVQDAHRLRSAEGQIETGHLHPVVPPAE
jgi:hypothetical protein